ncbi:MAG TPA: serine hydrolase domain-containing protein [Pyrinomonadaceae bacterium]|jgi:CubicO group peptidase (beta-lactamase class C family)
MNKTKVLILLIVIIPLTQSVFGQSPVFNKFIDSYVKTNNFNGTILIRKNKIIAYQKSFGFANFPFKVPNTIETKYKVASITKAFTSVLILQLVEQGKIDLNKTIKTYLPDYRGEAADKVTIHQLLNHTSGMKNIDSVPSLEYVVENGFSLYQMPHTSDEILEKYCSDNLSGEPGKKFDYNNADYIVLGKIIERLYGKIYERVLNEKLLQPLNMRDSGMIHQPNIIAGLADTYFYRDASKVLTNDLPFYAENLYAAGGMYSTAGDILKFSDALFTRKLLKKETLDLMFTPGLDEYGYGVWVYNDYDINGKKFKIVKRPGSNMGAQSMLFHVLEADTTIVILTNTGTTSLDVFAAEIAKRVVK